MNVKVKEPLRTCADVSRQMVEFIRQEKIPVHGKLPPLRELSSKFNVSLSTVRKAVLVLEEHGEVSIRHGSGIYVADKYGESVIETTILQPVNGNKTICIVDAFAKGDIEGHYLDNFVLTEVIQGAKEVCLKAQWGLKVCSFVVGEGEQAILHKIGQEKNNISLIVTTQHFLDSVESIDRMGVASIAVGPLGVKSLRPESLRYEISLDLFEAGALAGDHLARLGHQDVLYIGTDPTIGRISGLRHAGFCYAHKRVFPQGTIRELFVPDAKGSFDEKALFGEVAREAMGMIPSVSALFISSEQIALVAVPYLMQHGVRIPQTVSLVTIDNSRFGQLFTPTWTSVDLNRTGAARTASEMLLAWSNGLPKPEFYSSLAPSRLVVRESAIART